MTKKQPRAVELTCELPYGPQAPFVARQVVDQLGTLTDAGLTDDLKLLISEIVTNSVRHTPGGPESTIGLAFKLSPTSVRAEIRDAGKGFSFVRHGFSPEQSSGWGLNLVDVLADRWGTQTGESSTVWLELDLHEPRVSDLGPKGLSSQ